MAAALLLGSLLLASATGRTAAAPPPKNILTHGSVSPGSGSTTTTFVFWVDYSSAGHFAATEVVALVANTSVPMALWSGTNVLGTYRGSSLLPVGTWPVTFQATAQHGSPTLAGPTVVVQTPTPAPTPTTHPTSAATTRPTLSPTPAATAGSSSSSAFAGGGTVSDLPSATQASGGGLGLGSSTPAPSPAGGGGSGTSLDDGLGTFLTGGLAAIGLLSAVGFAAIWRDRRREREAHLPAVESPAPAPRRRPSTWERDIAIQDESIGTLDDDLAPGDDPA